MKESKAGYVIKSLLKDIIGVFPIVAPEKTKYPFAVYQKTSASPSYSKRSIAPEFSIVRIDVCACSDTYEGSLAAINDIYIGLHGKKGTFGDILVKAITHVDSSEDFQQNAYMQTHTYELIIY